MAHYTAPITDMNYLFDQVLDANQHFSQHNIFSDCSTELVNAVLTQAEKFTQQQLQPITLNADQQGVRLIDGGVKTPEGFTAAYKQFAQDGWLGLGGELEFGGQGLPKTLSILFDEIISAGDCGFALYGQLTAGAAIAINAHASAELKAQFLPKLYSGEWSGAMALTEPQAGTDLGLISSKATDNNDGSYTINGSKIFISGGDQDLSNNIVHLVLARLPDAPSGVKGISMFLVPKYQVQSDGHLGQANGVSCTNLENKMGLHSSSTCAMSYDGSLGYLVGKANHGLNAMFTMMNYERLTMGVQALGMAEQSYQIAKAYAAERLQSRAPNSKYEGKADPIIQHAEVRRMLLTQKCLIEGCRALLLYTGLQLDSSKSTNANTVSKSNKLAALLTPVCKAFVSDIGFELCVMGQQVLGGHGYIRDNTVEKLVRDCRISQIYEGSNGIQALDLLDRKVVRTQGEYLQLLLDEMNALYSEIKDNIELYKFAESLNSVIYLLESTTANILLKQKTDVHLIGAVANDYMHLVGHSCMTFLWAKIAAVSINHKDSEFQRNKILSGCFYIDRILPRAHGLVASINNGTSSTMEDIAF